MLNLLRPESNEWFYNFLRVFRVLRGKKIKIEKWPIFTLTIKDFGDRVQYSVFECLLDKNLLDKMTARIDKIIVEKKDSVR
ncbi:MAG: CRISPR-associated endonuclease Cas2, partial [Deltaproteobacteria bacterium]|nr:CRISPR-associated endonuclease Cas2 [Deltaproteobacteria bacterium]